MIVHRKINNSQSKSRWKAVFCYNEIKVKGIKGEKHDIRRNPAWTKG